MAILVAPGVLLAVGQIWKDNDPREKRTIKVIALPSEGFNKVLIQTVQNSNTLKKSRPVTRTNITRFSENGRNGFTFVK